MQGRITRNSLQDISGRAKTVIELSGASLDGTVITSRSGAAVYNCQINLVNADNAETVAKATVLSTPATLWYVNNHYGRLSWKKVLDPLAHSPQATET